MSSGKMNESSRACPVKVQALRVLGHSAGSTPWGLEVMTPGGCAQFWLHQLHNLGQVFKWCWISASFLENKKSEELLSKIPLALKCQDSVTKFPEQRALFLFTEVSLSESVFGPKSHCAISTTFLFWRKWARQFLWPGSRSSWIGFKCWSLLP